MAAKKTATKAATKGSTGSKVTKTATKSAAKAAPASSASPLFFTMAAAPPPAAVHDAHEAVDTPTKEQLQFARCVYILLQLWPALRQAVQEQWGGEFSEEKRAFLLSHLCDEYGNHGARTRPDLDDLTELIESYVMEEFDCELEDDSAALMAGHICLVHTGIFLEDKGDTILAELEATLSRTGAKAQRAEVQDGFDMIDDHEASDDERPAQPSARPAEPAPKQERIVDEDGFEMVQPRRRT